MKHETGKGNTMADIEDRFAKTQPPAEEDEAEVRSAAFAPVDTQEPVKVGADAEDEDITRRRQALGDVSETSGGQISEEVKHPYDGKGDVQRGVRDDVQNRNPAKRHTSGHEE